MYLLIQLKLSTSYLDILSRFLEPSYTLINFIFLRHFLQEPCDLLQFGLVTFLPVTQLSWFLFTASWVFLWPFTILVPLFPLPHIFLCLDLYSCFSVKQTIQAWWESIHGIKFVNLFCLSMCSFYCNSWLVSIYVGNHCHLASSVTVEIWCYSNICFFVYDPFSPFILTL